MRWKVLGGLLAVVGGLVVGQAQAQELPQCVPATIIVNRQGNGVSIPIGTTAAMVLDINTLACQRTIRNIGSAPMHCMPVTQGIPTATRGQLFNPGEQLTMLTEGRQSWQCIATTATPTMANTIEALP